MGKKTDETFLKILEAVFRWHVEVLKVLGEGILAILRMYPKASAIVLGIIVFLYYLGNVPGFGEMVAQVIAIALIIWAIKFILVPKKKTK